MKKTALSIVSTLAALPLFGAYSLDFLTPVNVGLGNAEIVSINTDLGIIATTGNSGIQLLDYFNPGDVQLGGYVDFSSAFGGSLSGVSSTALDPLGRGFGLATLIPTANGTTTGLLGVYDYGTGAVLGTIDVGYHPDSVIISADGQWAFVANEGENFSNGGEAPGSLSVIDLRNVTGVSDVVSNALGDTYDFDGQDLSMLRDYANPNTNTSTGPSYVNVEPEYTTYSNGKVYVSLQENNGIAQFDVATRSWTGIYSMGYTSGLQTDVSDRDGGVNILDLKDTPIQGMPMPDTIDSFRKNGTTYIVTANEGDVATNDSDRIRVKDFGKAGQPALDPDLIAFLVEKYGADYNKDGFLGRLYVSRNDGDTDGDGDIDVLRFYGDRGASIIDENGNLVATTGALDELIQQLHPTTHNGEAEGALDDGVPLADTADSRSDDKGVEPEALDVIELDDGTVLLALGLERQNGILLYDITDPTTFKFLSYLNLFDEGFAAPESIKFFEDNGRLFLLAGYEVSGNVAIIEVIPEPAAATALLGVAALGLAALRRRRA